MRDAWLACSTYDDYDYGTDNDNDNDKATMHSSRRPAVRRRRPLLQHASRAVEAGNLRRFRMPPQCLPLHPVWPPCPPTQSAQCPSATLMLIIVVLVVRIRIASQPASQPARHWLPQMRNIQQFEWSWSAPGPAQPS